MIGLPSLMYVAVSENLNGKGGWERGTYLITYVVYSKPLVLCKNTTGTGITSHILINSN